MVNKCQMVIVGRQVVKLTSEWLPNVGIEYGFTACLIQLGLLAPTISIWLIRPLYMNTNVIEGQKHTKLYTHYRLGKGHVHSEASLELNVEVNRPRLEIPPACDSDISIRSLNSSATRFIV